MSERRHHLVICVLCLVWIGTLLLPFWLIGESWGMIWFKLSMPVSLAAEALVGIGDSSWPAIALISVLHVMMCGCVLELIVWGCRRKRKRCE